MYTSIRNPPTVALVLILVAILGYVIGQDRSAGASEEKMSTAVAGSILLGYPSAWREAVAAPQIPGLSLAHPLVLAPDGHGARAGLLTAELLDTGPSPLPSLFLTRLRQPPHTEVVALPNVEAFRYARLSVPGFDSMLVLYAIPNPGGNPTALVCYASAGFAGYMRTCEQIVATATLVGQSQHYALTPEPGYARQVSASIGLLDAQRVTLRREMGGRVALATVSRLASNLAQGFAGAARSLSGLEPPIVAAAAHATLLGALAQARYAYVTLAAAANGHDPARYTAARTLVGEAETSVDTALETFALLGYQQA